MGTGWEPDGMRTKQPAIQNGIIFFVDRINLLSCEGHKSVFLLKQAKYKKSNHLKLPVKQHHRQVVYS